MCRCVQWELLILYWNDKQRGWHPENAKIVVVVVWAVICRIQVTKCSAGAKQECVEERSA